MNQCTLKQCSLLKTRQDVFNNHYFRVPLLLVVSYSIVKRMHFIYYIHTLTELESVARWFVVASTLCAVNIAART